MYGLACGPPRGGPGGRGLASGPPRGGPGLRSLIASVNSAKVSFLSSFLSARRSMPFSRSGAPGGTSSATIWPSLFLSSRSKSVWGLGRPGFFTSSARTTCGSTTTATAANKADNTLCITRLSLRLGRGTGNPTDSYKPRQWPIVSRESPKYPVLPPVGRVMAAGIADRGAF